MEQAEAVKREPPTRRRDWEFWAAIIWTGLFIGWIYYISRCLPGYQVDPNQTIRYSQLMFVNGRHDWPVYNPLLVFLSLMLVRLH